MEDMHVVDSVETDGLSNLPVRDNPELVEKRSELNKPVLGTSSEMDGRKAVLPQSGDTDQRGPCNGQAEISQAERNVLRRSQRQHEPPKRLQYPQLGNPLSLVIQSLLQGLKTAFAVSLGESDCLGETSARMQNASPSAVLAQPRRCSGTCIDSK